jgi:hypothetical protein
LSSQLKENARITGAGIEMGMRYPLLGYLLNVLMRQGKQSKPDQQCQRTFESLDERDHPQCS